MKRETLQSISLEDSRRRVLMMQLIKRVHDKPADTIAWYDGLSDDDKTTLLIGLQIGLAEQVRATTNLAISISPILGAAVRDIEMRNRGEEVDNANIT